MADGDWDAVDKLEKQMASLPGDSMPKSFGASDEDACDLTYRNKQIRFTFTAGLREKLTKGQTSASGELICGLGAGCFLGAHSEIKVDSDGKEVWTSKGGNVHKTKPPIDHHSPDWKDRLSTLEKKGYDVATFTTQGKALYSAAPLRIVHMFCNSKRNGTG